jgi:isoleucyl-tRNA synthetase
VEKEGTNVWFERTTPNGADARSPSGTTRRNDTLDVWIDSGVSHTAVMKRRPNSVAAPRTCISKRPTAPRLVPIVAHDEYRDDWRRAL